jgi:hypothetical protein
MYQYTIYTGGGGHHNNFAQGAEYSGAGPGFSTHFFISQKICLIYYELNQ